ncbi:uncharacterized protein LOC127148365 [Cucumis melo]|uniref:Uncharacterized protein LOC127148365 n=1 Tax=Cucumis melo TaxID=3656 RepID=A0ABM3KJ37_CUCME|nr:uncharacterized protein LOC127148365 [Cucumis melo]
MKVTTIEEAHYITTLKLDELFGSLLTFEMDVSDRENKKGKRIAFKSIYEEETTMNQSDNEANMDESIALLTKQFSKVVRKFKNMNTIGANAKNSNQYRRKDEIDFGDESECFEENYDEELTFEELKVLWKENSEARAIQKERIQDLMEENERLMFVISSLKLKLKEVQNDYDQTIKFVKMLNLGTENLYLILNSRQNSSSKYGLSFDASVRSVKPTTKIKFVLALVKDETETVPTMIVVSPPAKTTRWICYYCATNDAWYFGSGCSRHMTENKSFFSELKECVLGHVTFRDGARGRIIAKGNIDKNNLPYLNDVRYVDELKANLISVSQLYDQGYSVNFSKASCVVVDKDNHMFMSSSRQADNCYHWIFNNSHIYHSTKEDQTWLWHRKLGHISLRSIDKAIKNEAMVGIPNIDINSKFFCGDCLIGKQTKVSHKSLKECSTNRILELLHLDLMRPIQIESLGGKKYVFVAVDNFFRFT